MPFVSPRMSLKVWNASSDPYDHEQLADNFLKLDLHDHSQGRGSQIPGAGIQSGAITSDHIYPGAIGGDAIGIDSIDTEQLVDESVTSDKLHPDARLPVGTVLDWYCATPASYQTYLPAGWKVCDGSVIAAGQHEIPGVTAGQSFTIPNLIGQFTRGADPAASLNAATGIGGTGGSATVNLLHSHTYAHTHGVTGSVPNLPVSVSGTTSADGFHSHLYAGSLVSYLGYMMAIHPQDDSMGFSNNWGGNTDGGDSAVSFIGAPGSTDQGAQWNVILENTPITPLYNTHNAGTHTHTVTSSGTATGGSITGGTTSSQDNSTTGNGLSATQNVLPPYTNLLKIMKVRNV